MIFMYVYTQVKKIGISHFRCHFQFVKNVLNNLLSVHLSLQSIIKKYISVFTTNVAVLLTINCDMM